MTKVQFEMNNNAWRDRKYIQKETINDVTAGFDINGCPLACGH